MIPTMKLNGEVLELLDQRRLPGETVILQCRDYRQVADAIREMAVRGAPAIGVAAAFGLYLGAMEIAARGLAGEALQQALEGVADELRRTRPTAVNLFWALERMLRVARENEGLPLPELVERLKQEAQAILDEDVELNRAIGLYGQELIRDGDSVLTHCNAGALATAGYGTALGVIRAAHQRGKRVHVYVDETRPLLQGARLTAWEMMQEGVPATLITDSMAGYLMQQGRVNLVLVGADRIAANGDVANKIGTYSLAVLAAAHGISFYVAAPYSTIDLSTPTGRDIAIEERRPEEVTRVAGVKVAPEGIGVANPAFDVTPARYVTAIITDRGIARPPYEDSLPRIMGQPGGKAGRVNPAGG